MDKKHETSPERNPAEQNSKTEVNTSATKGDEGRELSYDRALDKIEGNMNNGETGNLGNDEQSSAQA